MSELENAVLPSTQATEEGRLFEKEFDIVLNGEKKDHPIYIGGLKIGSGIMFYPVSPIDETIRYGSFQEPEKGTMKKAVEKAAEAAKEWSRVPAEERASYFAYYLRGLKARRMHYAALTSVTSGMTKEEATAEVDFLITAIESVIAEAPTMKSPGGGVWAIVSQHNSPLASPIAYAVAAMIAGNATVMNPSNLVPLTVYDFYTTMEKFNLPGGVMNLIVDRLEEESTAELVNDSRLRGIVASGSGKRVEDMMFLMVDDELRFVNNLKGMSPAIVYRPADMKSTAGMILESAFAYSGQRIHSCSKVIVTVDEQRALTDALTEAVKGVVVGDPLYDRTFTGPLIGREEAKRFGELVAENSAFIVSKAPACRDMDVNYVSPIILAGLPEENELNYMDSGFPILTIRTVDGLDEAFEELADTECGMSAGLFSRDSKIIERFEKENPAPMSYINISSRSLTPVVGLDINRFRGRKRPLRPWHALSGVCRGRLFLSRGDTMISNG